MMFVIAVLILYVKQDIQAAQGSGGKADNVNEAETLILQQKTHSGFKVTFKHS